MMQCAVHRWRISRALDTEADLPAAVETHVADCAGCREYLRDMRGVCARLAQEARGDEFDAPADMHGAIMAVVGAAADERHQPQWPGPVVAIPAVALVALVLGLVLWAGNREQGGNEPTEVDGAGEQLAAHVGMAEDGVRNAVVGAGDAIDGPLEEEMVAIRRDIASAAHFLLGCLPSDGSVRGDG